MPPDSDDVGRQDHISNSAAWEAKERGRLAARAAHYADDARNIVARVTLYEDVHPDDAPCLESLLRAVPDIAWRGHDA